MTFGWQLYYRVRPLRDIPWIRGNVLSAAGPDVSARKPVLQRMARIKHGAETRSPLMRSSSTSWVSPKVTYVVTTKSHINDHSL